MDGPSIEAIKAELFIASSVALPTHAQTALDLGEAVSELKVGLMVLTKTTTNDAVEKMIGNLDAAVDALMSCQESLSGAAGDAEEATRLM